jgi:hypothetical protein
MNRSRLFLFGVLYDGTFFRYCSTCILDAGNMKFCIFEHFYSARGVSFVVDALKHVCVLAVYW